MGNNGRQVCEPLEELYDVTHLRTLCSFQLRNFILNAMAKLCHLHRRASSSGGDGTRGCWP